jgi:uncharacterized protein (UPF0335 family)
MPKAAKIEDDVVPCTSNTKVKDYTKRLLAINTEIKDATESRKELLAEAKSNGISVKELKLAVKIIEKPLEEDFKDTVNFYLDASGQGRFFA